MITEELAISQLNVERTVLASRVAVVTGSGRGIGREAARALAWLGARVVVAARSDNGRETERLIREAGGEALFVPTDVSNPTDLERLAATAQERFGPVDILINNAIYSPVCSVLEMEAEEFERVLAVNLVAAFRTCKLFLPTMLARRQGTIVNMVSTDAMPHLSAYIASKQGLAAFTQSLAAEVGRQGPHVLAFAPGFVDTPGLSRVAEALAPRLGTRPERFKGLTFHQGYAGTMPADHSGAATAYLVAALAREYHGEMVTAYTVLERAGFLTAAGAGAEPEGREPAPAGPALDRDRVLALLTQLDGMLVETEAEFGRLPMVFRPLARGGFKSKAGQGLPEWRQTVAGVMAAVQRDDRAISSQYPQLGSQLDQLVRYYQGVPAEMANFTRDQEALARARATMAERVALITALAGRLLAG